MKKNLPPPFPRYAFPRFYAMLCAVFFRENLTIFTIQG